MYAAFQRPCQILVLRTASARITPRYGFARYLFGIKRSLLYNSCLVSSNDVNDTYKNYKIGPIKSYNDVKPFCMSNSNSFKKKLVFSSLIRKPAFSSIKITELRKAPLPVLVLGFAGLLPFGLPPVQSLLFSYSPFLANCQLVYGAAILSFLGGVKWGFLAAGPTENMTWKNYGLSVIPSLVAAVALIIPQSFGFIVIIAGLFGAFLVDLKSSLYPSWLITLRAILTGMSVLFLFISLLQTVFH